MYPRPFDYLRPESVEQALDLKSETGGRFIAGGHSILPLMKLRMVAPPALVDIGRIDAHRPRALDGEVEGEPLDPVDDQRAGAVQPCG